jgi:hypothetical protein
LICISTRILFHHPLVRTTWEEYDQTTLKFSGPRRQAAFQTRVVLANHCLLTRLINSRPCLIPGEISEPKNSQQTQVSRQRCGYMGPETGQRKTAGASGEIFLQHG